MRDEDACGTEQGGFEVGDKKVRRMMGVMGIICIYL